MIVVVSGARAAVVTRIAMELTVVLVAILVLKVAVTISVAAAACLDRRTSASDGAVLDVDSNPHRHLGIGRDVRAKTRIDLRSRSRVFPGLTPSHPERRYDA